MGRYFFVVAWFYTFCLYPISQTHQFECLCFSPVPISFAVKDFSDLFLICFEYYLCNSIYFLGIWLQTLQAFILRKYLSIFTFWVFFTTPWPFSLALEVLTE